MNEQNPYQAPDQVDEALKPGDLVPQTFRQALWQGGKLGFKWGNRAGLVVTGLLIVILSVAVIALVLKKLGSSGWLDSRILLMWLTSLGYSLLFYLIICIGSVFASLVICTVAHVVRMGFGWVRR